MDFDPQAWPAASIYLMLQACLGLEIDTLERQISLTGPRLLNSLDELPSHSRKAVGTMVDRLLIRHEHDIIVEVLRREKDMQVLVVK